MAVKTFTRYGLTWPATTSALEVERFMIRRGGRHWHEKKQQFCGLPLLEHYKNLQKLVWPEEEIDPWAELALASFIENKITVLMGCKDTAKTQGMAKFVLCDYWCFPDDTLWLVSSTTKEGAELRVWGRIKGLMNRAKQKWPELEGRSIESLASITHQRVEDTSTVVNKSVARTIDRGIKLVPCKRGTDFASIATFIGVKAPRFRHCGDEVSLMGDGFLNAYNNFTGEGKNFKGIMAGNPTDLLDPLCRASRPVGGWEGFRDTQKTQTWRSSFFNANVICFDGRDTPNNGSPAGKPRYKHLISPKDVADIVSANGEDHPFTYMQAYGKPNRLLVQKRVITELLCTQHKASEPVIWKGGGRINLYALDPAYGGSDLCVGIPGEFGLDVEGTLILRFGPTEIIPIRAGMLKEAEDQIAEWLKVRLLQLNIASTSCFYGAFGKGTLGTAFARVFGQDAPIGIDEGGRPTARPVRDDLFTADADGRKRLMRCDEYYDRKISELWYSMRLAIEAEQIRELGLDIIEEGCIRIFDMVAGNKVSVETKAQMKKRMQGESPNKFDCGTFLLEGARQLGFRIARLGDKVEGSSASAPWKSELRDMGREFAKSGSLDYAA